jgi:uncharacterized membrane protein HdeD (DUF308 family)
VVAAWTLQLARGILALALGVTITLTLEHTPAFGLVTFGVFAVLSGAVLLIGTLRGTYAGRLRGAFVAHGVVSLAAGIAALVLWQSGLAVFAFLLGGWALAVGVLEGVSGLLARSRSSLARDWLITAVLTIALGVTAFVLPPDFVQSFSGDRGVAGTLTSSVILIGVVGAWAILVGVLQTISAVTIRTVRTASTSTTAVTS